MPLHAQDIALMTRDQVDELFRHGEVGAIPEGRADGTAIIWPGNPVEPMVEALVQAVAWQGKVLSSNTRGLRNRILPFGVQAIAAEVYRGRSWFDGEDCIVLDYSKRSLLARYVRDEIRRVAPGLYLGLVYLGKMRTIYFTLQFTV